MKISNKITYWEAPSFLSKTSEYPFLLFDKIEKYLGVTPIQIQAQNRTRKISDCRKLFCYLVREKTKMSLNEIGRLIKKDHATVYHNITQCGRLLNDKSFKYKFDLVS